MPGQTCGPIMVFDTNCVLCSGAVAFILAHERDQTLRFAGAWSNDGLALAAQYGFSAQDLNETFLVIQGGCALTRSDAGLAVAGHLLTPWRWLAVLRLIPRPIRDGLYSVVARRRYRWFGQRQDCTVVPAAARHRFIGVRVPPCQAVS